MCAYNILLTTTYMYIRGTLRDDRHPRRGKTAKEREEKRGRESIIESLISFPEWYLRTPAFILRDMSSQFLSSHPMKRPVFILFIFIRFNICIYISDFIRPIIF